MMPSATPSAQLVQEIASLLQQPEIRRALEARQGRLVLDWSNGHVTYVELHPRFKVGTDINLSLRRRARKG